MEREDALKIINALANGVSPITGEVFAADSPYQHPDTVRALFEAVHVISDSLNKPPQMELSRRWIVPTFLVVEGPKDEVDEVVRFAIQACNKHGVYLYQDETLEPKPLPKDFEPRSIVEHYPLQLIRTE